MVLERAWPRAKAMDPGTWRRHTVDLISLLRQRLPTAEIAAIAVDGTSGTTFLCDELSGQPLTPVLAYNDGRAAAEAQALAAHGLNLGAAAGPYGGPAKCLWLAKTSRRGTRARITTQGAWLTGVLLGRFDRMDEHNALKLGYDGAWHEAISLLPAHLDVPHIVSAGAPLGPLARPLARRLGLRQRPLVVAGTTDSTAAYLALGRLPPGTGVTSLGSTLVCKIESPQRVCVPEYGIYSHRLGTHWLVGGASNSGGAVLAHYFDRDTLRRLSAALPMAQSTGLDYYPLVTPGERFPINDPQLPPRLSPRPADDRLFLQGLLEGLAAIEARGYALLASHGAPVARRVLSTGGGSANAAWQAIRAQALEIPVMRAGHRPAAIGAARLARAGHARTGRGEASALHLTLDMGLRMH